MRKKNKTTTPKLNIHISFNFYQTFDGLSTERGAGGDSMGRYPLRVVVVAPWVDGGGRVDGSYRVKEFLLAMLQAPIRKTI